jgi:two-component sensor histidine kinase/HAMP domain-containing protein
MSWRMQVQEMIRYRSLKASLTIKFVLLSIIPILVIGLLADQSISRSLETEISARNLLLTRTLVDQLESFVEEPLHLLSQIEAVVIERKLVAGERIEHYLETVLQEYPYFEIIMLLDRNGRVECLRPFDPDLLGTDMSGQPYFHRQGTVTGRQTDVSPAFISVRTGQPTVVLSRHTAAGMIIGHLNLETLDRLARGIRLGEKGYAVIADRNGTLLAHDDRSLVRQRFNASYLNVFQKAYAGEEGTYRYRFREEDKIGSVARAPGSGWLVLFAQPVAEAFAPVQRIRRIIFLGMGLSLAAALAFSVMSLNKTLSPIQTLSASANKIAEGVYTFTAPKKSYLEIDDLARQFSSMAEAIDSREQTLKAQETLLKTITDNYPGRLTIYARDETVLFTAGKGYQQHHRTPNKDGGLQLEAMFGEKASVVRSNHDRAFNGEKVTFELTFPDHSQALVAVPLPEADGRIDRIMTLVEDITERKRAEDRIRTSLAEKETLLQEIHHRVKNNMQVITSLFKLQAGAVDDDRVRKTLQESQNRVYAMSMVHEILYSSDNPASIDLQLYLERLAEGLLLAYDGASNRITLSIKTDGVQLDLDKATPLGLVINELLSNAMKHAFPDDRHGEIRVAVSRRDGQIILTVADNGVGFAEERHWLQPETLGLQIVRILIENQLDGRIDRVPGDGTCFDIRFKAGAAAAEVAS